MKIRASSLGAIRLGLGLGALNCVAAFAGTAELVLPQSGTTSAGIYTEEGRLVRTLWSARFLKGGPLKVTWDDLDDDGQLVAPGRHRVKVLTHNVRYVWEGVIGNTSRERTGESVHRAILPINDMAFDDAGNGFYVVGYNEGQPGIHRFKTTDPQQRRGVLRDDFRRVFRYTATDGQRAYFANIGLVAPAGSFTRQPQTFVAAVDVATGGAYRFTAGVFADPEGDKSWPSVIDYDRDDHDANGTYRSAPSGIAVQRHGRLLFVAHGGLDEVRIYDKRSGERVGRIAARGVGELDVGPDDSLWALRRSNGRSVITHFAELGGQWEEVGSIAANLAEAAAIAVSPVDGTVAVVDTGTEQVKAFAHDGRELWTLGQLDGYRMGGPEVTNDRFWLSAGPTYVAFAQDGSFWIGDPGNARNLHFSAAREFVEQIMYLPHSYVVAVDSGNPTRVFCHFLEFRVDYATPLKSSWELVANWGAGLDSRYKGSFDGMQAVHTLANGRTYGVVRRFDRVGSEVVELASGGLRMTGARLDVGTKLYADGSLRSHVLRFGTLGVFSRPLEGFGVEGDPVWGEPRELARVDNLRDGDPYYQQVPLVAGVNEATYPFTDSGTLVSFSPGLSQGFHLGGLRAGDNRWLWRASHSGNWGVSDEGEITPKDGSYEIANGVHYPGNVVVTSGRQILYGYHGEAWRGGQANQWLHFYDNGLFIGQFGRPWVPGKTNPGPAPAEAFGNAFSPQLATVKGSLYLWHNDESAHAGVHRWRVEGVDRILALEAFMWPESRE